MRRRIEGGYRTRRAFLFWPKTMKASMFGEHETRWLEEAEWVQKYEPFYSRGGFWRDMYWGKDE